MFSFISFVLLLFARVIFATDPSGQCDIKLPANATTTAIYTHNLKWKEPVVKPEGNGVNFECSTGFLRDELQTANKVHATCRNGLYNGKYKLPDLLCRDDYHVDDMVVTLPSKELRSTLFHCTGKNLILYEVRRKSTNSPIYRVCYDNDVMIPKFSLRPTSAGEPPRRFKLRGESVWGFDAFGKTTEDKSRLSRGYVKTSQQRRTTASFAEKYNRGQSYPYYFNRGHLTAFVDFEEDVDQRATCQYINAAPQWDILNENSWSSIEKETREMLRENAFDWEVYTGTYGSIPTTRGPLYLVPVFDDKGKFVKGQLPVPMLFWKVIFNTKDRSKSRVFVGVNNPEIRRSEDITPAYKICNPVKKGSENLIRGSDFLGFVYECTLDEFLRKLKLKEDIVA